MRFIIIAAVVLLYSQIQAQNSTETLTNATVIKLTASKLPSSIITQKINQSICDFNVSTDALIELKNNGVSDEVINLMITKQSTADASSARNARNNANDKSFVFEESGIYFLRNGKYTNLDATIVSTTSPKSGLASVKYKSQIEGAEANYRLSSGGAEFYFNFDPVAKRLTDANANTTQSSSASYLDELFSKINSNGYSSSNYQAISPNDFKLVKLNKVKARREFVSGKMNAFGKFDMSIDDKNLVSFKYEKVSSHTFKIKFDKPLPPGEYCFVYLGNNNNAPYMQYYGQNNMKVFDFGIQ